MKDKYIKEIRRLEKIKSKYEDGKISEEEINNEDIVSLAFMYQLEILDLDVNIESEKITIESYKTRLKDAIEYLRAKNSNV